jgi:ribosomal protein S11
MLQKKNTKPVADGGQPDGHIKSKSKSGSKSALFPSRRRRPRVTDFAKLSKRYLLSYFIFNGYSEEFFSYFNDRLLFERFFFARRSKGQILNYFGKRRDEVSITGFSSVSGALSRFFPIRWKNFFKRRSYSRVYYRLFYSVQSQGYVDFKTHFKSASVVIFIRQTKNNVFFSVQSTKGRVLFTYTNGQTSYKGSRRCTPVACETAGKRISVLLSQSRIKKASIVFGSQVNAFTRAAVKGLSNNLVYSAFSYKLSRSHNGIKKRASRRV